MVTEVAVTIVNNCPSLRNGYKCSIKLSAVNVIVQGIDSGGMLS